MNFSKYFARKPKKKICHIIKTDKKGYGWDGNSITNCVIAIHRDKVTTQNHLRSLVNRHDMREEEYTAIKNMDNSTGNLHDLTLVKIVAIRFGVEVVLLD